MTLHNMACAMCTDKTTPHVAETPGFIAMPTVGCFVPGYLLVIPRQHVTSFGQLDSTTLAEADGLIAALAARLTAVYGMPVLGFEYGLNAIGARRIEHAHWHLLPSPAPLGSWLDRKLKGRHIAALSDLPRRSDRSYIAVRGQDSAITVYNVEGSLAESSRIRLRKLVADLDPRVESSAWDWANHPYHDLMRQTAADLAPVASGRASVGTPIHNGGTS